MNYFHFNFELQRMVFKKDGKTDYTKKYIEKNRKPIIDPKKEYRK